MRILFGAGIAAGCGGAETIPESVTELEQLVVTAATTGSASGCADVTGSGELFETGILDSEGLPVPEEVVGRFRLVQYDECVKIMRM